MISVTEMTNRVIEDVNKFNIVTNIPVEINPRLTATLGRCKFRRDINGKAVPYKIEISKRLVEKATDESVWAVVDHEACHAIAALLTGEQQGHNKIFKNICAHIGTTNDKTHFSPVYKDESSVCGAALYKYSLYCSCCGKLVGVRQRKCKITMNPEYYRTKCCNAVVECEQNY